jgi:HSP20 family protein
MAEKTVPATGPQESSARESTRTEQQYIQPPVDIYETADGLVVLADLPGVAPEDLDVRLEDNILTLRGRAKHTLSGEAIYREFELISFFRQFELTDQVDQEKITARLSHGVLMLELPKAAKAKPKQINIQVEKTA